MTQSANVDPKELEKFASLASRWWDPESEFKPLHDINPLRAAYIAEKIGGFAGQRILDVGCGGGLLAEAMAVQGAEVTGIDLGKAALSVARLHSLESGVKVNYREISVEQLASEEPASFDAVTCLEMLEHVPDPAAIVAACQTLVKPGGPVFFSTINRNPKSYLFAIIGAEYILRLLPKGTHDYARFIKPSELSRMAREARLELKEIIGMSYNPFNKRYSLGDDVDVNYLMYACRDA